MPNVSPKYESVCQTTIEYHANSCWLDFRTGVPCNLIPFNDISNKMTWFLKCSRWKHYYSMSLPLGVVNWKMKARFSIRVNKGYSFLLGLLFCPEDGSGMPLYNVGPFPNYGALQPRRLLFRRLKSFWLRYSGTWLMATNVSKESAAAIY
jgi:hypothetical protein